VRSDYEIPGDVLAKVRDAVSITRALMILAEAAGDSDELSAWLDVYTDLFGDCTVSVTVVSFDESTVQLHVIVGDVVSDLDVARGVGVHSDLDETDIAASPYSARDVFLDAVISSGGLPGVEPLD